MRCSNEHYVPTGFAYCRRCVDGPTIVAAPSPVPTAALMTMGDLVEERDRLVLVNAGVVAACAVLVAGGSIASVLPAVLAGVAAYLAARVAVRLRRAPLDPHAPASSSQVRMLDRLVLAPALAVVLTVIVSFLRW